jgi:hypothetical protein
MPSWELGGIPGLPSLVVTLAGKEGRKRLCGGCKGQQYSQPGTMQSVWKFSLQAPARRSYDGLDFGPLWRRKTNTRVFLTLCFS